MTNEVSTFQTVFRPDLSMKYNCQNALFISDLLPTNKLLQTFKITYIPGSHHGHANLHEYGNLLELGNI